MPDEILYVKSRRRARMKKAQTMQHVLAAFILILAAVDHLTNAKEHHVVLPVLELLAGITMIGSVIVEKIRKTHARVAWVEFAGAALMFVEAIAKTQQQHHFSFYVLSFVAPVMLLTFAIFDARIERALYLKATSDALEMRLRLLWRRRRIAWEGLTSYRIGEKTIELFASDGETHKLRIDDIADRQAAVAWADAQFRARGLSPAQLPGRQADPDERKRDQALVV
ncbi:MAG TPA: hypothetical protein VN181_13945 [Thermoanaerobaculia bacterium]|nr:hypothetical protein [Thermoanaerobaculia bacterium]